jgi:RNA polymerase sigma-70 factor (ECF subfamily)
MHTLAGPSDFPTTRWTLVIAAADPQRNEARSALVSLCESYWYPLYAYIRRRGYPATRRRISRRVFRPRAGRPISRSRRPDKGRFRAFILTSMKFFLADEGDRIAHRNAAEARAVPRNLVREERYQREPAHNETPERIFERRWALSVLDRVVDSLRAEFVQHGRLDHFNRLKVFLLDQAETPYATLAREDGHIRRGTQGRDPQAPQTLSRSLPPGDRGDGRDPADIEPELRYLAAALAPR